MFVRIDSVCMQYLKSSESKLIKVTRYKRCSDGTDNIILKKANYGNINKAIKRYIVIILLKKLTFTFLVTNENKSFIVSAIRVLNASYLTLFMRKISSFITKRWFHYQYR